MILDFIISNFTVLMIVAVMCVIMYVNKDLKIPAVSLARVAVILILITAVLDYLNDMAAGLTNYSFPCSPEQLVRLHTALCVFSYILRPVIILIELLIICPDKRLRIPIIVPSVVNALIYLPTLFGRPLAFYFTSDNAWVGIAPFNLTIYLVLIVYLFILLAFSVIYFSKKNRKCSVIILAIVLLSLVVAVLEYFNIMTGYTTTVTAMGTLTYYIYLSTIYQQKIRETVAEKELTLELTFNSVLPFHLNASFYMFNSETGMVTDTLLGESKVIKASFDGKPVTTEVKLVVDEDRVENVLHSNRIIMSYELDTENHNLHLNFNQKLDLSVKGRVKYKGNLDF